jgi:hypothetical protein
LSAFSHWTPARGAVDESSFDAGRFGPYRVGAPVRKTELGEVRVALHESWDYVVELEVFHALKRRSFEHADLLADLNQAMLLVHPQITPIIGAGIEESVPYVVRPHRLGRTLAELLERQGALPLDLAAGLMFAVAEAIAYLAEAGPSPDACAMGGFDQRDVFLGFDGSIALVGTGQRSVRAQDADAAQRDEECLAELSRRCSSELYFAIRDASAPNEAARRIRRTFRDACARRREHVGSTLRHFFGEAIQAERAFFGLAALH